MGYRIGTSLIKEAGLLAGRDDLSERCVIWLQAWLDSVAASWPWPMLQRQATGVALNTGATSLVVGGAGGIGSGITTNVVRIIDNMWAYTSDRRSRNRLRIDPSPYATPINTITDTANGRGMPNLIGIRQVNTGSWQLTPNPIPDRNFLLVFDYMESPLIDVGQPLWYPNDFTVLHGLVAIILEMADGAEQKSTQAAQASVSTMLAADRIKYGQMPGINDRLLLDPSVFR